MSLKQLRPDGPIFSIYTEALSLLVAIVIVYMP